MISNLSEFYLLEIAVKRGYSPKKTQEFVTECLETLKMLKEEYSMEVLINKDDKNLSTS